MSLSEQLAEEVGLELREACEMAGEACTNPPLYRIHQLLMEQIPTYKGLVPDKQAELIVIAVKGWTEWSPSY